MLNQAAQFLLENVLSLFVFAALLRFYMQVFRAPYRNPLTQFVVALTDFAVLPLRKLIPGLFGVDMASLFFAWILEFLLLLGLLALSGGSLVNGGPFMVPAVAVLALVKLFRFSIYLLMIVVFAQAILSWVNPYSAVGPLLEVLSRPFLRPIRKVIPLVGNVDLSPLVLFLVCQLVLMLPVAWLEQSIAGMLHAPRL